MKGGSGNLWVILATKDRYKTDDELTVFGAIDFRNTSFNHSVKIQDKIYLYFLLACI